MIPSMSAHHSLFPDNSYSIDALTALGFTKRTIQYYIQQGILPYAFGGRGQNAYYGIEHIEILHRLRVRNDAIKSMEDLREEFRGQFPHAEFRETSK